MKRILLGIALLIGSAAAWSSEPCCSVVAINAKTGVVSVKNVKTGKVTQYKAEPVGIKGLKVGDKVDLVSGQLRTAAGAAIAGPAATWTKEPIAPCCGVVAINAKTGVVSVKDVRTGKVSQYKAEPVGIKALKVGDKVDLVGGRLLTAAGAAIAGRVQP